MGSSAMDAMQVLFTAFDTGISSVWREEDRSWRSEERRWRTEDVDYREEERRWRAEEGEMRCNEQRYKTLNTTTTSTTTFVSIAAALSNPNNSIHFVVRDEQADGYVSHNFVSDGCVSDR